MNKTKIMIIVCILQGLVGCQSPAKLIDTSENFAGKFWCNERYLNEFDAQFDEIHLTVAEETYIYAIASSIAINNGKPESIKDASQKEITFTPPARMQQKDAIYDKRTGFSATTFWLYDQEDMSKPQELVIAFSGTNEAKDWWTNLTPFGAKHYKEARNYLNKMVSKYGQGNSLEVVVTGYSLGGGISLNALKKKDTRDSVDKAVIFNSSPKSYSWDVRQDSRLWSASTNLEGLKMFRRFMRSLGASIAPDSQRAEGYNLSQKNIVKDHFNYILTRSLLHVADYAISNGNTEDTEPMKILKLSTNSQCEI